MSTTFDSKSGLYVCIRQHGIVGYGKTSQEAEAMADAAEVAQAKRAREMRARSGLARL